MASLQPNPVAGGTRRRLHPSLSIDMTPLVDLGFLLITFFVFTTSLSSNAVMPLMVPKDGPPTDAGESNTLTVLLGRNNEITAYSGFWENAAAQNRLQHTSYSVASGIGALIRQKQSQLVAAGKSKADFIVLVKPSKEASYKNVVDMLDELTINMVTRYALVAPDALEAAFMEQRSAAVADKP
jgi:biopolymer transport protein ExbD